MKKYLGIQLKRVAKVFPFVVTVTLVLLLGLGTVLYGVINIFLEDEASSRFIVGVTGDTDNEYMNWAIAGMKALDETKFSIEFEKLSEEEAKKALGNGDISAYVIFPEDFVEKAVLGKVEPITYVTSAGMEGIAGLLKKEITTLATEIVIYSQKGVYGLGDAFSDNGLNGAGSEMNKMSIEYAEFIFNRNEIYSVNELGISDGLSTIEYYVCAVSVMLFVLIGLPFAAVNIKKDYAFNRLLLSRGYSTRMQVGCEYAVHLTAMLLQTAVMLLMVVFIINVMPDTIVKGISGHVISAFSIKIIPVMIMISAFNIMMFELSGNIVSGLLLHFFSAIGLCYISGCMFPIYAFPTVIRNISSFLPIGMARSYLASSFTADYSYNNLAGIILYAIVFYGLAIFIRSRKLKGIRRRQV